MKFAMESKSQRPGSHLMMKKSKASDVSLSLEPPTKAQAVAENVEAMPPVVSNSTAE
jgi:hypothetical protein